MEADLKRDMDLIRDILMKIEGGQQVFEPISSDMASCLSIPLETPMSKEEADQLRGHLDLLDRDGTIEIEARQVGGSYLIKGLTRQGHDYLDRIRDPDIWQKAKSSTASAGEEPRKDRLISDEKNPEVFTLKPAFMGMSVNLKELWRKVSALGTRQK
jgi:hypothetical protein